MSKKNIETQKSTGNIQKFEINFSNEYIISEDKKEQVLDELRNELENETISKETKIKIREDIEKIEENGLQKNIYQYFNLFIDKDVTFFDYLDNRVIYFADVSRCFERAKAGGVKVSKTS